MTYMQHLEIWPDPTLLLSLIFKILNDMYGTGTFLFLLSYHSQIPVLAYPNIHVLYLYIQWSLLKYFVLAITHGYL